MTLSPSQWELIKACTKDEVAFFTLRDLLERVLLQTPPPHQEYLDTLPAHVAILDHKGMIVTVNQAWQRFADANQLHMRQYGVGANYLEICDAARDLPTALQAAHCIREVLAGRSEECESEYPCHSPNEQRWFVLRVTPFTVEDGRGALVAHINVTARTMSVMALTKTQELYRLLAEHTADLVSLHNPDTTFIYASPSFERVTGYAFDELVRLTPQELVHPDDVARVIHASAQMAATGETVKRLEYRLRIKSGEYLWLEAYMQPIRDDAGNVVQMLLSARDISERKAVEDRMWESEELLGIISDNLPGGAVYQIAQKPGGEIYFPYVGASIERLFGVTAEEAMLDARNLRELIHEEDFPAMRAAEAESLAKLTIFEYEFRQYTRQGDLKWIQCRSAPKRLADGTAVWDGIVIDITERKRIEERLRENQQFVEKIMAAIPSIVYVFDLVDNRNVFVNREVALTLGYSPQEVAVMGSEMLQTIMPPEDYERQLREQVRFATVRDEDIIEAEYNFRHANGELRTLYIRNAIFARSTDGSPRQILGVAHDITERKQAELALRQSEARYRQLLEYMPLAIAVMDIETLEVVYLNPAAQEFLHANAADLLAFPGWAQTLSPEERSTVAAILQQWGPAKIMPPTEIRTHNTDGRERFILAQSLPIIYEGRQSLLNILTDITEHKRIGQTEVEKEDLARALEQQQEMNQLKTRILTRISHEFRTPLAIIMSAGELLDRYYERLTQEKRRIHLAQIGASVDRLTRLLENIEQILQTSRLELNVFDLEKLCADIVRRMRAADKERHTLLFASGGNLASVYADARRMEYLISNLMTNALLYSDEGTTIYLDLTAGDGEITFRVSDNGRGISEQDLPRIFEPFFRGENVGEIGGMGISLSIVKEIVDLHRGTIDVDSTLGRGTTITVRMPLLVDSLRM